MFTQVKVNIFTGRFKWKWSVGLGLENRFTGR